MVYDCYLRAPREPAPDWPEPYTEEAYGGYRAANAEWEARTHNYFRRNLSGGRRLADALIAMAMGFDALAFAPLPDWPAREEYGAGYDDEGATVGDRAKEYDDAVTAVRRWHGPEIPGIPVHKVCTSNDGWIVTREECRAAVQLYEFAIRDGKAHPEAFGDDFVPFLREAADTDGYEVW